MTAQQHSPSQIFHIPPHSTTDSALLQWVHNEIQKETKKRRRSIDLDSIPPQKSPRKNDDPQPLISISKHSHNDILLAYKRIWNNLDLSLPSDAKLEPFVWRKIRELQQNK